MLKTINPYLNTELLQALRSMDHGDELVLCDCNFPSASVATQTVVGEPINLDGLEIPELVAAVPMARVINPSPDREPQTLDATRIM